MADNQNGKRKLDEDSFEERKKEILKTGKFSDCSFVVGTQVKEEIRAHRSMLAIASPVYETMFFGSLPEQDIKPIPVEDIEPNAFRAMLKYIYTTRTDFTCFDDTCQIFCAAKKYMIPSLVEECKGFIVNHLGIENVCSSFALFSLYDEKELVNKCLYIIRTRTKDVMGHQSFEDVDTQCLKAILSQDKLNATELELWEGTVKWSRKECERRKLAISPKNQIRVMRGFFSEFRFLTMTGAEFANGVALSKILNNDECLSILMNITSPSVIKMSNNFSNSNVKRINYHDESPVSFKKANLMSGHHGLVFSHPNFHYGAGSRRHKILKPGAQPILNCGAQRILKPGAQPILKPGAQPILK